MLNTVLRFRLSTLLVSRGHCRQCSLTIPPSAWVHLGIYIFVCLPVAPLADSTKYFNAHLILICAFFCSLPQFLLCVLLQTSLVLRKQHSSAQLMLCLAACHGVASKHSEKCRNMSADFSSSSRVNFCTTPNSPNCSPSWPDLGAHHPSLIQILKFLA